MTRNIRESQGPFLIPSMIQTGTLERKDKNNAIK